MYPTVIQSKSTIKWPWCSVSQYVGYLKLTCVANIIALSQRWADQTSHIIMETFNHSRYYVQTETRNSSIRHSDVSRDTLSLSSNKLCTVGCVDEEKCGGRERRSDSGRVQGQEWEAEETNRGQQRASPQVWRVIPEIHDTWRGSLLPPIKYTQIRAMLQGTHAHAKLSFI